MPDTTREIVQEDNGEAVNLPAKHEGGAFDLASVNDPTRAIRVAEELVASMAQRCSGPQYVANISGKKYPKVEWWTTVGAALGLFPREEANRRLNRTDEVVYEATVAVYRGDQLVTRASAVCSSEEKRWSHADEYAVRSMAATRATGKAYRLGLSFLAVMSGLEATPAEEIPDGGFEDNGRAATGLRCPDCGGELWDNRGDKKAGRRPEKFPDYKCKSRECDWAHWGTHPDEADPLKDRRRKAVAALDAALEAGAITEQQHERCKLDVQGGDAGDLNRVAKFLRDQTAAAEGDGEDGDTEEDETEDGDLFGGEPQETDAPSAQGAGA